MPSTISFKQFGIWVAVGFATGVGWGVGTWLVGRVLGVFVNGV